MRKKVLYIKSFLTVCAMLVMALSGNGCGVAQDETGDKLVLYEVAHSVFFAPLYVAIEEGDFREQGIAVELISSSGKEEIWKAVMNKDADVGLMGCDQPLLAYADSEQENPVIFAILADRAGEFLVSREEISDFKWDMLKGEKILCDTAGGMQTEVLDYVLNKYGIDPSTDLEIEVLKDHGTSEESFLAGDEDYVLLSEPEASLLVKEHGGYEVAALGQDSGCVPYIGLVTNKSYVNVRPEMLQAFSYALQKGLNYVKEHRPEEIASVIAPQFKNVDIDTLVYMVSKYKKLGVWRENLSIEKESFGVLQNILKDSGVLIERVPYEAVVNAEFAKNAAETKQ